MTRVQNKYRTDSGELTEPSHRPEIQQEVDSETLRQGPAVLIDVDADLYNKKMTPSPLPTDAPESNLTTSDGYKRANRSNPAASEFALQRLHL